jgi:periplasmic divalent cation tolerance protein
MRGTIMNNSQGEIIVMTTIDHEDKAAAFAHGLVEERIAACVTRLPAGVSVYRWQSDQVAEEKEYVLLIKTHQNKLESIEAYFESRHPYQVPEIMVFPAASVNAAYSKWLHDEIDLNHG